MPLSELFVADDQSAYQLDVSHNPSATIEAVDAKGLETVKLESLWRILNGDEPGFHQLNDVVSYGEESVIFKVPFALMSLLKQQEAEINKIAQEWGGTEEFASLPKNSASEYLQILLTLAEVAMNEQKDVFLWMSVWFFSAKNLHFS